jgi:uncharacterized protein (TIGR03083 family)
VTTDDAELADLDPFDLLDREAARLDAYFTSLADEDWSRPSRCAGWSIRDVLAHLAWAEGYHRACLDGKVAQFRAEMTEKGGADIAGANAIGIRERDDRTTAQLIAEWRAANAATRQGFRARGDGRVDTSVGTYPNRWQAFHVAGELAVHADDVYVPVGAEERAARRAWRARFSRFALAESKPDIALSHERGHRTRVEGRGIDAVVDDDELIEGVAGRLDDSSRLDPAVRALLNTMP